jgi:hypothetical protein
MNAPNEVNKDLGILRFAIACLLFLVVAPTVNAQQITGTPGSPSATETIDGNQIPAQNPRAAGLFAPDVDPVTTA